LTPVILMEPCLLKVKSILHEYNGGTI
jgi:hypothetical protein